MTQQECYFISVLLSIVLLVLGTFLYIFSKYPSVIKTGVNEYSNPVRISSRTLKSSSSVKIAKINNRKICYLQNMVAVVQATKTKKIQLIFCIINVKNND